MTDEPKAPVRCTGRCLNRYPCSSCEEMPVTIDVKHNGEKIGEVRPILPGGPFAAYLQGGGTGFDVRIPVTYPNRGAAIAAIRDAHEPDPNGPELGTGG